MGGTIGAHSAQPVADTIAASYALRSHLPSQSCDHSARRPQAGQAQSHGLARGPFLPDELCEMTNVFCLFMFTCLNPSHIKACFCISHDRVDPAIYISTNQARFGENEDGLDRCADRMRTICCSLLASITPQDALDIRNQILKNVAHHNWPKIGSRFGLCVPAAHTSCTDFAKDIKIPAYFPDKLRDTALNILARLDNNRDNKNKDGKKEDEYEKNKDLIAAMQQLAGILHGFFGMPAAPQQRRSKRRKNPNGDEVTPEGKLEALLAVYSFYQRHGDRLRTVLACGGGRKSGTGSVDEWMQKLEDICQYVDGATFLCNLALGNTFPGTQDGLGYANTDESTRSWFRNVTVVPFQLPEEAFLFDGTSHPKHRKHRKRIAEASAAPPAPPCADGAACARELSPDPPPSPVPSGSTFFVPETTSASTQDLPAQFDTSASLQAAISAQGRAPARRYKYLYARHPVRRQRTDKDFAAARNNALGLDNKPVPKIHAEISLVVCAAQLLERYTDLPGIYIGSYKKTCYCCHHFMRAIRLDISTPQSHSKIYPSWRLPDHPYLQSLFNEGSRHSAADWHGSFCAKVWATLNAAINGNNWPRRGRGVAQAQDVSEDIQLGSFDSIDNASYSSSHWEPASSATRPALSRRDRTTSPATGSNAIPIGNPRLAAHHQPSTGNHKRLRESSATGHFASSSSKRARA